MIEVSGLSKSYGEVQALRNVSFSIGRSEVVGLLGPNGAGKTTLMKILTGYLHPTEGTAEVDDHDVVDDPLAVQRSIGYLPENAPLYEDMLVQESLQMIAALREIPEHRRPAMISDAVRSAGLVDHLVRPIGELSKGYRQRVGLAQAILHKPDVLILDEPTSGLDPSQIVEIRQLISDLAKHSTVLLSTHILSEVELSCERVLIIAEGEVRTDERLDDLRAEDAAIVAIEAQPADVQPELLSIEGVTAVTKIARAGGSALDEAFTSYRVAGGGKDLCPLVFDRVKQAGWRMAELRSDQQTLETIFRDVTESGRGASASSSSGGGR